MIKMQQKKPALPLRVRPIVLRVPLPVVQPRSAECLPRIVVHDRTKTYGVCKHNDPFSFARFDLVENRINGKLHKETQ